MGAWDLPFLTKAQQKTIANKLRKRYMNAGFKPLFRGSSHLFLTNYQHMTATQLIDEWNEEHGVRKSSEDSILSFHQTAPNLTLAPT